MATRVIELAERRRDFPILSQEVHPGVKLIYMDSAATAQKPAIVLETLDHYYREMNSNVHRGVHSFSEKATAAYEKARDKVRDFVGAESSVEIIFTRNTTESINLVAYAWGLSALKPGDEIVLTEMEHHSNIVPWQIVAERQGAVVRFIPISDDGRLDLDVYRKLLESGKVRMVAVAHVSNVLGTINPVAAIAKLAHNAGALVLVDAAQGAPHLPLDVRAFDADFLAFSGHKVVGPMGVGVLYGKQRLLEAMPPFLGGGSMIREVTLEKSTFAALPQKFEAGTPSVADAIGLGAAIDYLRDIGLEVIQEHEQQLTRYALDKLGSVPGLRVIGPTAEYRVGVASFSLQGVHPHDVAAFLDSAGIAVRAGHHCAMPLHDRFGLTATTRASFYLYNTLDEIDTLVATLGKARAMFAR
ncbi:MAG TPA: cysteine desulfurase [Aggregatilineales bacterium]|nr:cysteine desulfurase [Aggregatilineales bacterium]